MKIKKKVVKVLMLFLLSLLICGYGSIDEMTVKAAPKLTTKTLTMKIGEEKTLQVKGSNAIVKWSSSNKSVVKTKQPSAINNSKIKIVALKAGNVNIKATVGKKKFTVKVKVKALSVKKTISVKEGKQVTLTVKNAGKKITWSCNNNTALQIVRKSGSKNEKIILRGLRQGQAKLTGKIGSTKFVCTVNVTHTHVYAPATCNQPQKCACGATKGQPNPTRHIPNIPNATCATDQVCTVCHIVLQSKTAQHTPNIPNATCTEDQVCTLCGTLIRPRLNHDYVNGICTRCKDVRLTDFVDMQIDESCFNGEETKFVEINVYYNKLPTNREWLYFGDENDHVNGNVGTLSTGGSNYQGFLYRSKYDDRASQTLYAEPDDVASIYFKFTRPDIYIDLNASVTFPIRLLGVRYKVTVTRVGYTYTRL